MFVKSKVELPAVFGRAPDAALLAPLVSFQREHMHRLFKLLHRCTPQIDSSPGHSPAFQRAAGATMRPAGLGAACAPGSQRPVPKLFERAALIFGQVDLAETY